MKSFRMMRLNYFGPGPSAIFAGYVVAVDLIDATIEALRLWGPAPYAGFEVPGPIPATFSPSHECHCGMRIARSA